MGNCQAIDAATLVIQHPSGKLDKLYWPVTASEIMRTNPGHYVALLITTTVFHPSNNKTAVAAVPSKDFNNAAVVKGDGNGAGTVRVTRVKLLRPTDILALGHAYRLISTQEVMKGMVAKKQAKMKKDESKSDGEDVTAVKDAAERITKKSQPETENQGAKQDRNRSKTGTRTANTGTKRPGTWRPSLNSISEAAGS